MKRCDNILRHRLYKECIEKIEVLEKDRIYCLHGFSHAMDTARIMYIKSLEDDIKTEKEIIYATAILHDIGRVEQYEKNIPHDISSCELSKSILPDCGFDEAEIEQIICAISEHRKKGDRSPLGELLYFADNKSRMCMQCSAISSCKWREDEMNMGVEY